MASFFKRVVTAALERRQEVRDLNLERQEKAVQVGVERLQEAEKNRIKKVNLIRKRNTKVKPFILSVEEKLGKSISPAVAINLLAETPDPSKAILAAEQMLKTNPDALSSKQLESDTADVQQQTNQMLSRQGDMTMPVSVQQGKMAGDQAISSTRMGGENIGREFVNALFGALTGAPTQETQALIQQRYASLFPTEEEGLKNYRQATEYLGQVMSGEDPTTLPSIDPSIMSDFIGAGTLVETKTDFDANADKILEKMFKDDLFKIKAVTKSLNAQEMEQASKLSGVPLMDFYANKRKLGDEQYNKAIELLLARKDAVKKRALELLESGRGAMGESVVSIITKARSQIENNLNASGKPEVDDPTRRSHSISSINNISSDPNLKGGEEKGGIKLGSTSNIEASLGEDKQVVVERMQNGGATLVFGEHIWKRGNRANSPKKGPKENQKAYYLTTGGKKYQLRLNFTGTVAVPEITQVGQ